MSDTDLDVAATTFAKATAHATGPERVRLRDDFVRTCMPFAGRLARRYRGRGERSDDLEQVARLGLVKAVDRFDDARGSFTAYAVLTIYGEIKKHFRDRTWAVHVTRRLQEAGLDVKRAETALTSVLHREPTQAEIARHLDIPVTAVREAMRSSAGYRPASLNAPAGRDGDTPMLDLLGERDPKMETADDRLTVAELLKQLPVRERRLLSLRFSGNRSQMEIATELGVSQMHVSRLLQYALAWLREAMLSDSPPPFHGSQLLRHTVSLVVTKRARTLVVAISGEIDHANATELRHGLQRATSDIDHDTLVLDLCCVPLIDAAGVAVLLDASRSAAVADRSLKLVHARPTVAHVLAMTGMDALMN